MLTLDSDVLIMSYLFSTGSFMDLISLMLSHFPGPAGDRQLK